jgi:hypothetical protein
MEKVQEVNLVGEGEKEKEKDVKIDGDEEKGEGNVLAGLGHHYLGCERVIFSSLIFWGGS